MNYPSGGFPAQGPQQPQQGGQYYPQQSQQRPGGGLGFKLDLGLILCLVVAFLGLLILFFGFIDARANTSFYAGGVGWVPALYLLAGLAAVTGILPGDHKPGVWPAIVSLTGTLTFMFTVFELGSLDAGGIMVLIFGIIQTLVAVGAYLINEKVIKLPAPGQQQYAPQGYGAQGPQAYGQPQQGYGLPQTGQQQAQQPTTYTGHQGQFTQQPPQQG
ncbi:MAG: DUF5336 domain-containing protein [Thermocrispum sp.]